MNDRLLLVRTFGWRVQVINRSASLRIHLDAEVRLGDDHLFDLDLLFEVGDD